MNRKQIGFYDYTVILTYCGMISAFTGICFVMNENYLRAIICLMISAVCDMFDGTVANIKDRNDQEKRFGIQIDSLSDLISFGVLPAAFVYKITGMRPVCAAVGALFVLCGLIRLAYYNVTEEDRQKIEEGSREYFLGFPITSIAILLPAAYVLLSYGLIRRVGCFEVVLLVTALAFVTPVSVKKPHAVGKIILILIGIVELVGVISLCIRGGAF